MIFGEYMEIKVKNWNLYYWTRLLNADLIVLNLMLR